MQDIVIVGEVDAGHAAAVRKSLKKAIQQVNVSTFDVIELLHKVRKERLFTEPTFSDFVDTLGLKKRTAQYWERIGEVMAAIDAKREEYEPIGVTKLRVISRLEPTTTYTNPITNDVHPMTDYIWGLMEMAPTKTAEELEQSVRVLLGEVGENDFTWLNVRVPRLTMTNVIAPAIEKAKTNIGSVATDADGTEKAANDARALEVICVSYNLDASEDPEVVQ